MGALQMVKRSEDEMQELLENNMDEFREFASDDSVTSKVVLAYMNFALARHFALRSLDDAEDI